MDVEAAFCFSGHRDRRLEHACHGHDGRHILSPVEIDLCHLSGHAPSTGCGAGHDSCHDRGFHDVSHHVCLDGYRSSRDCVVDHRLDAVGLLGGVGWNSGSKESLHLGLETGRGGDSCGHRVDLLGSHRVSYVVVSGPFFDGRKLSVVLASSLKVRSTKRPACFPILSTTLDVIQVHLHRFSLVRRLPPTRSLLSAVRSCCPPSTPQFSLASALPLFTSTARCRTEALVHVGVAWSQFVFEMLVWRFAPRVNGVSLTSTTSRFWSVGVEVTFERGSREDA